MKNYIYQNSLIGKKQLRQLLAWSFTNYDSMQACDLADELKYLGFKYASLAGISISIEDLKVPFIKNLMLEKANQEILNYEKIYLKGKITDVERFQKIIDTWNLMSESLKEQVISYFKKYDPLNSVYIMAFSGARGNLSQVRQLVGMRGLMSDPSGEIMKLPIKKNFREGLTITDYLMSGYGARKGIVDTALKTANSGYLTRRLIDVSQDILIREKDCKTIHSFLLTVPRKESRTKNLIYQKILGRVVNKPVFENNKQILQSGNEITPKLIEKFQTNNIQEFYIRSPLTCNLYRAICQKCYGWDLANENLVDIGEAVGILAGQSIGEPGTQLTMRTFHTGGIFTSETKQQIISPLNGIIRFYKLLKTILLRTNRGEDVLITKNSGSIILIPENKIQKLKEIEILRNTILFPKNNQYILKDTVIGELININKQVKTEIKPILSHSCGEILILSLKKKINSLNNNKLIWILSGQLYNSPKNSFINFYPDYKLNSHSFIFRTKFINHYKGFITFINNKQNLYQNLFRIGNIKYLLSNSNLEKLTINKFNKNFLLNLDNLKYLLKVELRNSKFYLKLTQNQQFAQLITPTFQTLTGGTIYYDHNNLNKYNQFNKIILYLRRNNLLNKYKCLPFHKTLIWLGEEIHKVNCESNILLVEHNDFISKGFELIPGLFSKTSGIVKIRQKNNFVQTISIKPGLVYVGKKFKNTLKKVYYTGEIIFSNISIIQPSFCEYFIAKDLEQLLIRPIEIYEFPYSELNEINSQNKFNINSNFKLESKIIYSYKSNQKINGTSNLSLISNILIFKFNKFKNQNLNIELVPNKKTKLISLYVIEKLFLNNYILPNLRYKNFKSCFIIQHNQFVDKYTTLGYLEAITLNSLEITKFKIKTKNIKQILLISNEDCIIVNKSRFENKKLNDFILNSLNVNEIGKIIIENNNFFTIQKGRPYFFPNCRNDDLFNNTNLQYKVISSTRISNRFETKRDIFLKYYDLIRFSVPEEEDRVEIFASHFLASQRFKRFKLLNPESQTELKVKIKKELKLLFKRFFLKRNGKLYSSIMPIFFNNIFISNSTLNLSWNQIMPFLFNNLGSKNNCHKGFVNNRIYKYSKSRTLLMRSSTLIKNHYKKFKNFDGQLTLVKFFVNPFRKSANSIGLYSITEDYFEQEVNSIFCKNNQFIENGETIGLLNIEKEITGDIVQGLPRIEEILEARKKNITIKRIPTNKKKNLLIQKTSLDPNFEFRKLGTPIKENEKINPHKLLKIYFNYYGLLKSFSCDFRKESQVNSRLIENYEGSYNSFKKVQLFILNSVQAVYQSQGVSINDKHLEIIIKQMTTKVLITSEGNTPLLKREVIDLYHINYINQIVEIQKKQYAYYVPLLLGITKAALNNPSFISAASFQETTKILTKAAIEGQIDWLRGLKENIIIGHLIPAGTGSQNYKNCFKKNLVHQSSFQTSVKNIVKT